MKLKHLLCLVFFLFSIGMMNAQDIHFSQYSLSPMTTNPAKAGSFKGTFRVGGIYRDQWGTVLQNQYRTPSFYIDAPIVRGFRKKDWVGIGVHFLNDQSGAYNYQQTNIGASKCSGKRAKVFCSRLLSLTKDRNCLGNCVRDRGQRRVPLPPHNMMGTINNGWFN